MNEKLQIFESVFSFALLTGIIYTLKTRKHFTEADGNAFSKLLVDIVVPATIFLQLSTHRISSGQFTLVLIMFFSGIITMLTAYIISRLLKLSRPATGAFLITSSFGSSSLIGYPLIQMAFPDNPGAMTDAVLISELGVGLPLFIICPVIAIWFGGDTKHETGFSKTARAYFISPVFIALILGMIISILKLDFANTIMEPVVLLAKTLSSGIGILSGVVLGIYLKPKSLKGILLLIFLSALLEMGFQPMLTSIQASLFGVSEINRKILIFISSMPAAILGPVFAARYNCASDTAASIAFSHILFALISIPLINFLL